MKKILKSKKGFTLIELLAVIVVLAIIMVIATQQVNGTIRKSRANAFVESYQMLIKQVKTFIASDEEPTCPDTTTCLQKYDLSDDYSLSVTEDATKSRYEIVFSVAKDASGVTSGKKFTNVNLNKDGSYNSSGSCDKNKIASGADSCTENSITGYVEY